MIALFYCPKSAFANHIARFENFLPEYFGRIPTEIPFEVPITSPNEVPKEVPKRIGFAYARSPSLHA